MKDAIEQLQAIVLESVIEIESKKVTLETLPIYAKEVYQKWTNKLESISSLTEQGLSSIIRNELSKEKINFDFRDRIKNLLNETIIKSEIEKITKKIKEQKKYFEDKDKRIISPKFETVKHKLPYSAETYEVIQQVINETSKKFVEQSKIDDDALIKEIKNCTEQKIKQLELYSRVTLFTNEILNEPNNGKYTQIKFPDFAIEAIQESIYKLVKKKLPIKDDRIKKEIRTQLKIKKPPISIPIQIKTNKLSPGFMELVIAEEISKISNPKLRSKIENIYLAAGEMPKDQKKLIELFDKAREDNSFSDILNLLAEPSVLKFWSYRVMFKKNKTSFKNKNFIIHGVILNDYINENLIACHIPDTFLRKKLVAHFDFNSEWITAFIVKKKYVKRSSEISGKSKNDFSSPITYKLISKFQRKLKRTILNKELKSLVKTGKSEIELSEEDYNFFVNKVGKTFSFREHKDKTKETDKSYQNIIKEKIRDIQSKLLSEKIFVTEEDIEDIFFYTKIKISKVASYEVSFHDYKLTSPSLTDLKKLTKKILEEHTKKKKTITIRLAIEKAKTLIFQIENNLHALNKAMILTFQLLDMIQQALFKKEFLDKVSYHDLNNKRKENALIEDYLNKFKSRIVNDNNWIENLLSKDKQTAEYTHHKFNLW